MADTLH
ncbi:hypothetical protein E2C01_101050 [Portunus trituberculatus]|nr:hypothetical protein [Portunus trituberculatus]